MRNVRDVRYVRHVRYVRYIRLQLAFWGKWSLTDALVMCCVIGLFNLTIDMDMVEVRPPSPVPPHRAAARARRTAPPTARRTQPQAAALPPAPPELACVADST